MTETRKTSVLILIGIAIVLGACSSAKPPTSAVPSFTPPPDDEGSAILVYTLSSKQDSSGFSAFSSIGIPVAIFIDADNPKVQTHIEGSTLADYEVTLGGMDRGIACKVAFTYLVDYEVKGFFNPNPKCDFDVQVIAEVQKDSILRTGTCSLPVHESYPAEVLFIPPPPGLHKVPGSLPVVPLRSDGETRITIQLTNVVVPTASGCFFGG